MRKSSLLGGLHVDDGGAVDEEGFIGIRIEAERNNSFLQCDKKPQISVESGRGNFLSISVNAKSTLSMFYKGHRENGHMVSLIFSPRLHSLVPYLSPNFPQFLTACPLNLVHPH